MDQQREYVNREKRFEVDEMIGFDAIVCRAGVDESQFHAELIDFSRTGMKLDVPFCARFNEILNLRLEFNDEEYEYEGKLRVRHMRNLDEHQWQVGCSIDPPLPQPMIEFLAKTTNQERRQFSRLQVDGVGTLRRQGQVEGQDAEITNLSRGGMCLAVETQYDIGEKVDFLIADESGTDINIASKVRWQKSVDGSFQLGCSFMDPKSYEVLISHFGVSEADENVAFAHENFNWKLVAAATIALVLPSLSFFLTGSGSGKTDTMLSRSTSSNPTPIVQKLQHENIEPRTEKDQSLIESNPIVAKTNSEESNDGRVFESELPKNKVVGTLNMDALDPQPKPQLDSDQVVQAAAAKDPKVSISNPNISNPNTSRRFVSFDQSISFPGVGSSQDTEMSYADSDRSNNDKSWRKASKHRVPVFVPWEEIKPKR